MRKSPNTLNTATTITTTTLCTVVVVGVIAAAAYILAPSGRHLQTPMALPGGTSPVNKPFDAPVATVVKDMRIKGNRNSGIYHLRGCPNYKDIADYNVVWFKTKEEAKLAGFRRAKNC